MHTSTPQAASRSLRGTTIARRLFIGVFALLVLTPASAFASAWGRGATARSDGGSRLACDGGCVLAWIYGTEGWFHVDEAKVNSLYALNIYGDLR